MGRYRQGRKLFYAALALLLVVVVVPASVAIADAWNNSAANSDVVYLTTDANLRNNTVFSFYDAVAGQVTGTVIYTYVNATGSGFAKALQPAWDINGTLDGVLLATGSGTYSKSTALTIIINGTSAYSLFKNDAEKIHLTFKMPHAENYTIYVYALYADTAPQNFWSGYQVIGKCTKYFSLNTTSVTLTLDKLKLASVAEHKFNAIAIRIASANSDLAPGDTVYFNIDILKPHGTLLIGGMDFMQVVLWIFTIAGVGVFFVTSPAWNPTTHNGLIERMVHKQRYKRSKRSKRHGSRRKSRRKRRRR